MQLKIIITWIFAIFISVCGSSQKLKKIIAEVNNNSIKSIPKDSILALIQRENDFVIGYSVYNESKPMIVDYYLIGIKKNKFIAHKYFYSINRTAINEEKPYSLSVLTMSKHLIDSVIRIMKKNNVWTLKHLENDEIYCPLSKEFSHCIIHDALSKDMIVMTKSHQNISKFYAPEYFELECCPGNSDRQRFLALIKLYSKVFE